MKIVYICLIVCLFENISCMAQTGLEMMEENKEYPIFDTIHVYLLTGEESDETYIEADFIKSLPIEIKAIIAAYSAYIYNYILTDEVSLELAKALGDYASLEEAQHSLSELFDGKDLSILPDSLQNLSIIKSGDKLRFIYYHQREWLADEYDIKQLFKR